MIGDAAGRHIPDRVGRFVEEEWQFARGVQSRFACVRGVVAADAVDATHPKQHLAAGYRNADIGQSERRFRRTGHVAGRGEAALSVPTAAPTVRAMAVCRARRRALSGKTATRIRVVASTRAVRRRTASNSHCRQHGGLFEPTAIRCAGRAMCPGLSFRSRVGQEKRGARRAPRHVLRLQRAISRDFSRACRRARPAGCRSPWHRPRRTRRPRHAIPCGRSFRCR